MVSWTFFGLKANSIELTSSIEKKNLKPKKKTINEQLREIIGPEISENEVEERYTFQRELGRGATSIVYSAYDRILNRQVAIKIFDKASMINIRGSLIGKPLEHEPLVYRVQRRLKKIIEELKILKRLNHPNIVQYLHAFETDYRIGIVHELVEGGDLFQHIVDHGKMSESMIANFCRQILSALKYCHEQNIYHRDLKLENILMSKDHQTFKLIDFGLAESTCPNSKLYNICGTPLYCSPEMLLISSKYDYQNGYYGGPADIWSVGIILFALSTGCASFDDSSIQKLRHEIRRTQIIYPSYLSNELIDLISLILCLDANERLSIHDILSSKWIGLHYNHPEFDLNQYHISSIKEKRSISTCSSRTTQDTDYSNYDSDKDLIEQNQDEENILQKNIRNSDIIQQGNDLDDEIISKEFYKSIPDLMEDEEEYNDLWYFRK